MLLRVCFHVVIALQRGTGLGIFNFFHRKKQSEPMPESSVVVGFDTEKIWCRRPDKPEQSLAWPELTSVVIGTGDEGPLAPDVLFILGANAGALVFPQGAAGSAEVLRQLQSLPGFDNETVIKAMGCTETGFFTCWKKPPGPSGITTN
jgi:hypothetical protein